MTIFRIMSYHIDALAGGFGSHGVDLCANVIRAHLPDLVMLQQSGPAGGYCSVSELGERLGLAVYGDEFVGGSAFLSRYPLRQVQRFSLGHGGNCLRADFEHGGERVHLFNLTLVQNLRARSDQVRLLFGDQLLNNPALTCASIIAGDFGLPFYGDWQNHLNERLRRARYPLWRGTFPARFPLLDRDRIYFQGAIRSLAGHVIWSAEARRASRHLPLVLTVETRETREPLKLMERAKMGAKQPNPICG
ncbi:MAG: hypothetical protein C0622_04225 [Desulfuromonas sp.]|nr:MAG: hypothetical protein C0622_04225 [Desulfuromonas sp.]